MFYSENEITEDLICPECKQKYTDPRVLPCGKILCNNCISNLYNNQRIGDTNEFKCSQCNQNHPMPSEGFPVCEPLAKLLNRKPSKLFRSSQVEELEKNLKLIDTQLKKLEIDLNHGEDVIQNHASELAAKVQQATDAKIELINKYNKQLMDQIEEFKNECLKTFGNLNKNEFFDRLKDTREFVSKWSDYLTEIKIDDKEVKAAYDQSKEYLAKLFVENNNLQSLLFNDRCFDYRKVKGEADNDMLDGKMVIKSFDSFYYSQWEKHDMSDMFYEELYKDLSAGYDGTINIKGGGFFENDNFVVAAEFSRHGKFDLILMVFDKSRTFKISTKITEGYFYNFVVINDKCCLIHGAPSLQKAYLTIYNESLERLNQVETESLTLLSANESYIFCRSGIEIENPLIMLNWSEKVIKKLGQRSDPSEPFYFANVIQFASRNDKFYFLDEEDNKRFFKVMDENSGRLLNKIEKDFNWILFDASNNILLIDDEVNYATEKGDILKQVKLVNFPHGVKNLWGYNNKNNLWCFDTKKFILSIKNF